MAVVEQLALCDHFAESFPKPFEGDMASRGLQPQPFENGPDMQRGVIMKPSELDVP
ncbi:MAG: hypothetical protein BroJett009_06730 [Armatimonadota bacterium]|nr:MAG: hypothetical protein BroJett009_06730 [Armatimonadota bacterium]